MLPSLDHGKMSHTKRSSSFRVKTKISETMQEFALMLQTTTIRFTFSSTHAIMDFNKVGSLIEPESSSPSTQFRMVRDSRLDL
jgi:hypothetical protein